MIERLIFCFTGSFINGGGEFIAHKEANEYFNLSNCKDELEVKCKVLEYFSRGAYKTEPFSSEAKNDEFHEFMLSGINEFLDTEFTEDDMEQIYTYLGNCCNRQRTIRFIESGYDLSVLSAAKEGGAV